MEGAAMAIVDWIGTAGLWSVGANWSGGSVPTATDDVNLGVGSDVAVLAPAAADTLDLFHNAYLTILSSMTVGTVVRIGFGGSATSQLRVAGGTLLAPSIEVGPTSSGLLMVLNGGTVTGPINVNNGSVIVGNFTANNAGTITGNINLNGGSSNLTFRTSDDAAYGGNISGVGSILVDSAGRTATLTGNNSGHSGTTTIQSGTLQIGNGGSSGSLGTGAVINNGNLAFVFDINSLTSRTVSGAISGTGNLNVTGGVQLTLAADNSYSGTTTIANDARLYVGNGGATGTLGTGDVVHNGSFLRFYHSTGTYVHSNAISGNGEILIVGAGTEIFTGNNDSYSGTIRVSVDATLVVGNGGTTGSLGSGTVRLEDGAQLHLNRSDTQIIANDIVGAVPGQGTVRVVGNHTAILTGVFMRYGATIIDSGSTLQIGNGGSTGTLGLGAVTNNGTLSFNHSFGNYFHGNVIGGAGGITVNGSGAENVSGVNSYSGLTTINSGTLSLQGAGSISNSASLTLTGTGRFDIANITAASTSVRDVFLTAVGTEISLAGKTLIVTHADLYAGPGRFTGSVLSDALVFNVVSASYTLAGATTGAVFTNWTAGQDSITINGNALANTLTGDELQATTINGGAGNDRIEIHNGGGNYDGGTDIDTLAVGSSMALTGTLAGFEAIELSAGANLTLTGSQFRNGLATNSTLTGTGTITVNMDAGVNFLASGMGFASTVATVVNGTSGIDIIKLGLGASTGNTINSGDGVDQIRGSNGVDTINGGIGNDKIMGIGGADVLTGGAGNDQFRYFQQSDSGLGAAADQITDFTIGGDRLNFLLIDADAVTAGDQAFNFVGTAAFANTGVGQIRYQDSGADLLVQADVNGDGISDMEIILQGRAGGTLTAADFIL
jgi:autotransporter-associated beta strand protein